MALNQLVALDNGSGEDPFTSSFNKTANTMVNVQTAQQRQQLMDLDAQSRQQKLTNQNALRQLMPGVVSGDKSAIAQGYGIDPEQMNTILTGMGNLQKQQRDQIQFHNEQTGQLLNGVESAPPEQREQVYQAARAQAAQLGIPMDSVPQHYDQNWVRMTIRRNQGLADAFKSMPTDAYGNPLSWNQPGQGTAPPAAGAPGPGGAPQPSPTPGGAGPTGGGIDWSKISDPDYVRTVTGAESGNNPNAKSKTSSAAGTGQFVNRTWLDLMQQSHPELTQGRTPEQILAMRSNPQLSAEMTDLYGQQNASFLTKNGVQNVGSNEKSLAHFLGPQGALNVMQADPSTPITKILDKDTMAANANIKFGGKFFPMFTAGDLQQ